MKTKRYFTAVLKPFFAWCWGGVLMALTSALLLSSCSQDEQTSNPEPTVPQTEMTLEVRIPGLLEAGKTYGMSAADEVKVNELTILLYTYNNKAGKLVQKIEVAEADITNDKAGNMKVKVKTPLGKYHTIALIANANKVAATLEINSGYTALEALQYSITTDTWNTANKIPMSAMIASKTDNDGLDLTNNRTFRGLILTRMLARIDIINSSTSTFTLKNVYVYNMNKNGTLVTDKTKYGATPKRVNLPDNLIKTKGRLDYDFAALATSNGTKKEMLNEIYVFEAAKADKTNATTIKASPKIIVYGTYNGTDYYYPVDFTYSATTGTVTKGDCMPVIRNHKYTFDITKVAGVGFTSVDDALEYPDSYTNTNMQVKTHQLDDDFTDVYYDDYNYLAVNTPDGEYYLGAKVYNLPESDNTLSVLTNAESFKINCYNDDGTPADWLSSDTASYIGNGNMKNLYLTSNIVANATTEFDGYIVITAGRLRTNKIPVHKWWCGKNGIPLKHEIGGTPNRGIYLTHRFGSACWMVENLRMGSIGKANGTLEAPMVSAVGYGSVDRIGTPDYDGTGSNEYYYTWEQAQNACPNGTAATGWVLPTNTEPNPESIGDIADLIANTGNLNTGWTNPYGKKFWGQNTPNHKALTGWRALSRPTYWYNWGSSGEYWGSGVKGMAFSASENYVDGPTVNSTKWRSVRCLYK